MKTFRVIVADPPWIFNDELKMSDVKRSAASNYDVMTISDIKKLPIKDFADPNGCLLALWVPSSLLQDGLDTMKAWGFNQKQTYVWVKTKKESLTSLIPSLVTTAINLADDLKQGVWRSKAKNATVKKAIKETAKKFSLQDMLAFGMGRLFRQTHEICLIGTSNNKIYKILDNKSQRSVSLAENLKHSAKPEHLQNSLDQMFPNTPKMELFARRHRPNWVCLGNEICNGEDIRDSLAKL